jgi:hypothetical protein
MNGKRVGALRACPGPIVEGIGAGLETTIASVGISAHVPHGLDTNGAGPAEGAGPDCEIGEMTAGIEAAPD